MAYIDCSALSYDSLTLYLGGLDTTYIGNDRYAYFKLYSDPFYENLVDTSWQVFIADGSSEAAYTSFSNLNASTRYYAVCYVTTRGGEVVIYRDYYGNSYSVVTESAPVVIVPHIESNAASYDYISVYVAGLDANYSRSGRYAYYALFSGNNPVEEKWIYDIPVYISEGIAWTFTRGIRPSSAYHLYCYIYDPDGVLLRQLEADLYSAEAPPLGNPYIVNDSTSTNWDSITVHVEGLSALYPNDDRTIQWFLRKTWNGEVIDTSQAYSLGPAVTYSDYHTFDNSFQSGLIQAGETYYVSCKIWPGRSPINTESWETNCWAIQVNVPSAPIGDPSFVYKEATFDNITVSFEGLNSNYSENDRTIRLELYPYYPGEGVGELLDTIQLPLSPGIETTPNYTFNTGIQPDSDYIIDCTIWPSDNSWESIVRHSRIIHTKKRLQIDSPEISYDHISVRLIDLDTSYSYANRQVVWKIYSPIKYVEYATDYIIVDGITYWLIDTANDLLPAQAAVSGTITFDSYIYPLATYYVTCSVYSSPYDPETWRADADGVSYTTIDVPWGNPGIVVDLLTYDAITVHLNGLSGYYPYADREVYWTLKDSYGVQIDYAGPYELDAGVLNGAEHTFGSAVIDPNSTYIIEFTLKQKEDKWPSVSKNITQTTPSVQLGDPYFDYIVLDYDEITVKIKGFDPAYSRDDRNIKLELYRLDPGEPLVGPIDTITGTLSNGITETGNYTFNTNVEAEKEYHIWCTIWPDDENSWSLPILYSRPLLTPTRLQIDCTAVSYDYMTVRLINFDTAYSLDGRTAYWKLYSPIKSVESSTETIEVSSVTYYLIDAAYGAPINAHDSDGGSCTFENYIYGSTSYYLTCEVNPPAQSGQTWTSNAGPTEVLTLACTAYIDCSAATFYYLQVLVDGLNTHCSRTDRTVYWDIRESPEQPYFDHGEVALGANVSNGGTFVFDDLEANTKYYISCYIASPDGRWYVDLGTVEMTTPDIPASNAYIDCSELTSDSVTIYLDNLDPEYSGPSRLVYWDLWRVRAPGNYEFIKTIIPPIEIANGSTSGASYKMEGLNPSTEYFISATVMVNGQSFQIRKDYEGNDFIIKTKKGKPPLFEWYPDNGKTSGGRFNLLAAEWNDLEDNINLVRAYNNMLASWFTKVSAGQVFTASHYNEIVISLREMPIDRILTERTSGEDIYAVYLNDLRDAINSVPREDDD